jgi:hypothetical protein
MEFYTYKLNHTDPLEPGTFDKQDIVEDYSSLIWTERYYGDSECELTLSRDSPSVKKLPLNIFMGIDESNELMVLETIQPENDKLKFQGISLLSWLNNRFIRTSKLHKRKNWKIKDMIPGQILWYMLISMVGVDSTFLDPTTTDIPQKYLDKLKIPEIGLHSFDDSDDPVTLSVGFLPLYDEMKRIATTYQIGMKIILESSFNPDPDQPLGFQSYKGLDRTSLQDENQLVRFSAQLDSLQNVQELQSQSIYKTIVFSFAQGTNIDLGTADGPHAGVAFLEPTDEDDQMYGFDCRAEQIFTDITGVGNTILSTTADTDAAEIADLQKMLGSAAKKTLANAFLVRVVDGEVTPNDMFVYGRDYSLGDLIEYEADDGTISVTRVTENIRSEESAVGERHVEVFSRDSETLNAV